MAEPMILKFTITDAPANLEIRLGDAGGIIDATVDWGDGSQPEIFTESGKKYHTVSNPGTYIVTISGTVPVYGSGQPVYEDNTTLTEVVSLGQIGTTNFIGAFSQCKALTTVNGLLPPNVTNMQGMFYSCDQLVNIPNINDWDVSIVTEMPDLFSYSSFNQSINNWNTSNVFDMRGMFAYNTVFNQPLNNWNTSNVVNMNFMFQFASSFNQDISSWCVQKIPSKPFNFDGDANNWEGGVATRPKWGNPC